MDQPDAAGNIIMVNSQSSGDEGDLPYERPKRNQDKVQNMNPHTVGFNQNDEFGDGEFALGIEELE